MLAMRCHEFDANIEELLSGTAMPEADEHMRQCERCTSHFRARAAVKNNLRHLGAAAISGPSRATDRAVMEGYRRLRLQPAADAATQPSARRARLLSFPRKASALSALRAPISLLPMRPQQALWGGAAAAAVAVAVLGAGLYRSNQISPAANVAASPAVRAVETAHGAPASEAPVPALEAAAAQHVATMEGAASGRATALAAKVNSRPSVSPEMKEASAPAAARTEVASAAVAAEPPAVSAAPAAASPVLHLASTGAANAGAMPTGAAATVGVEPAPSQVGATWPGYSNLMYCDPLVCSGPMPVVRIRVPARQVSPDANPGTGDGYVNADVVIGPDGVARAIRVAN
jgi:hypothetical protein